MPYIGERICWLMRDGSYVDVDDMSSEQMRDELKKIVRAGAIHASIINNEQEEDHWPDDMDYGQGDI